MTISARPSDRMATGGQRRWDPFRDIDDMYQQMNRLLQAMSGDRTTGAALTMADVEETGDAYTIRLDVPGVKREDIDIQLDAGDLMVTGEIKEPQREGTVRRRERPFGRFEHIISLPREINPDNLEAKLNNGVLTVRVGKAKVSSRRRIEVKEGE